MLEHSPHERVAGAAEREGQLHLLGKSGVQEGVLRTQTLNITAGNGASTASAFSYRAAIVIVDLAGLQHHGLYLNDSHPLSNAESKRPHPVGAACVPYA